MFNNYAFEMEGICKILNKKPYEINVLEFGMGWGFWSNVAKAFNFNVAGVEISEVRTEYAKKRGLMVIKNISKEKNESYDYIYADQVFEHIPNPGEVIRNLARILKKGGIIHIKLPNGHKIERKLIKTNWEAQREAIHPLEHINCYNRKSLKILAEQANLTLVLPPHFPKKVWIKSLFKNQLVYIYYIFYSTPVYFKKVK